MLINCSVVLCLPMKFSALIVSLALLAGCSNGLRMDTSHPSVNHDSRVQFVVLHYTSTSLERSLELLTRGPVSSHYLVGDTPPTIYKLVDENQRAWHAGRSRWHQYAGLNASSLGIEIVNLGYPTEGESLPAHLRRWQPYTRAQIAALGALARELVDRYQIPPTQVLAHSDIAPERKQDPGPHFPWRELALHHGVGAWPDEARVAELRQAPLPLWDAQQWQQQLAGSLPQGRGHVRTVGTQADVWVIWDEADTAGAQAHDSCPAGLSLGAHTRCLYLRIAL